MATKRVRGEITVELIIDAARACFLESGVAQTNMGDIAQRAGVSRPHLYTFLASRTALVEAAALARLRELGAELEKHAQARHDDVLEAIIDQLIETSRLGHDDPEFTMLAGSIPRFELNDLLTSGTSPLHEICSRLFAPLLGRALAEGRLRSDVSVDSIVEWLQGVAALLAGRSTLAEDRMRTMVRNFVVPSLVKY